MSGCRIYHAIAIKISVTFPYWFITIEVTLYCALSFVYDDIYSFGDAYYAIVIFRHRWVWGL